MPFKVSATTRRLSGETTRPTSRAEAFRVLRKCGPTTTTTTSGQTRKQLDRPAATRSGAASTSILTVHLAGPGNLSLPLKEANTYTRSRAPTSEREAELVFNRGNDAQAANCWCLLGLILELHGHELEKPEHRGRRVGVVEEVGGPSA